jgi:hypothetical protein
MTMDDERMCPVCGPLDGKAFPTKQFPPQPAHPNCRCTSVVTWPLSICGGALGAKAADEPIGECIVPPQAIVEAADAKVAEEKKLKEAFEGGAVGDLSTLTVKQLQTLAKQNGIAVARTKPDFIKLLDQAEPGIDHNDLSGAVLKAKLAQYKIAALRSKEELVALLAEKQAALKQAQQVAQQMKALPKPGGLQGLTVSELQEVAKGKGVSLNMTKQDVIELLDELEPGVDHTGLSGASLAEAKKQHKIGPLKNKTQLVKALEKSAGNQLAEQAKQEALDQAKKAAAVKAQQILDEATAKVVVPPSPTGYEAFLKSITEAETALGQGGALPQASLEGYAKDIALKKKLFADQVAAMKSGELKDLAKASKLKHWQWATKDEMVVLFSETDPAKVAAAKEAIEKKHAAWAEKHGSKKGKAEPGKDKAPAPKEESKPAAPVADPSEQTPVPDPPKPAPIPAPPKPTPAPEPSKPVYTKKGSEFEVVDAAWAEKGKPENFKFQEKANVGGAHEKEFWTDANGVKWLFKPVKGPKDDFLAAGDETAYRIGRLIDPNAIEVRSIKLNGRMGSIQKWRTDLKPKYDFSGIGPEELTPDEIAQIQREHVVDWLIANHDGHAKQFLRTKDGQILGIDKGQLFKHLGSDQLSVDYHPNSVHGESEPYYNAVFRAAKQKKVSFDPAATLKTVREVEKIPDEDYLAALRPYAEGRFGKDKAKKEAFYATALARKNNIRRDFETFYGDVLGQKDFRFEQDGKKVLPPAMGRLGKRELEAIEEVADLGWQGKTIPLDQEEIEDQNALIFTEGPKGKERTVIKFKVREEADLKVLEALKKGQQVAATPKVGQKLDEDGFSDAILAAVKTANTHAGDGKYNQGTLTQLEPQIAKLEQLRKSSDPEVREMAENYLTWINKVQVAVKERKPVDGGLFNPYLRKSVPPKQDAKDGPFIVKKTKALHTKRSLNKGELGIAQEGATNNDIFVGYSMPGGEQYEAEFPDGTRVVYRPWNNNNLYAQRGEFELVLPNRPDGKSVELAMERIESLGLNASISTPEDTELMYLTKQAYVLKAHKDAEYKKVLKGLENKGASKEERLREMRGYWERRLGVSDLSKLPGYDPEGEHQHAFKKAGAKAGYRHQFRFDLSDEELEKQMPGYALSHSLTNGEKVPELIDTILTHNGAMVSTIEKMRIGLKPGGMSPKDDMDTGGASYFFTRIKKAPTKDGQGEVGLYFKKRLLRRMDAVSYNHDAYGRTRDGYVESNRGSRPEQWKEFSERSGNETIFKYNVTLLDNVEAIVVNNEAERKQLLDVWKKHGITTLPDGRNAADVVYTRYK